MKQQKKLLIILAGVLVVLVAALAISNLWPDADTEETETTTLADIDPIFESSLDDVASIEIVNANDRYTLLPREVTTDGEVKRDWQVEGLEDYPFTARDLESLANLAANIRPNRIIEEGASNLAQYGLADPETTYTVLMKDGTSHVIKFGRQLPSGSFDYVMADDSGRVAAIASATANRVRQTKLDLLDKNQVLNLDLAELSMFTFERARDDARIVTECEMIGEIGSGSEYIEFNLLEPIRRPGSSDGLTRLVDDALTIQIDRFVALDPDDLSEYGLDNPQYAFTIEAGSQTTKLLLGAKAEGDNFYAYSDQFPAVFLLSASQFTAIDMRVTDMLDRFVHLIGIWTVEKIEADLFGESFTVEIDMTQDQRATDEDVVLKLDGEDAKILNEKNRSLFTPFYQRLISVYIAGLDTDADPDNTADGSMIFYLKADEENNLPRRQQVVEFAQRDEYTYYVFMDGEYTGFYIDANAAFYSTRTDNEGILVALERLRYAMEHAVDGVFDTQEGYQLD